MRPENNPPPELLENESEEASVFVGEDSTDILEASTNVNINDNREPQAKVDAKFFNSFDDDFDESDMNPPKDSQ